MLIHDHIEDVPNLTEVQVHNGTIDESHSMIVKAFGQPLERYTGVSTSWGGMQKERMWVIETDCEIFLIVPVNGLYYNVLSSNRSLENRNKGYTRIIKALVESREEARIREQKKQARKQKNGRWQEQFVGNNREQRRRAFRKTRNNRMG